MLHSRFPLACTLALAVVITVVPSASARQLFVAPGGSSSSCEQYAPCTPEQAINGQARGADEVIVSAGSYTITAPLVARDQVTLRGAAGETRPTLTNDGTGTTLVTHGSGGAIYEKRTLAVTDQASARHLRLVQTGERAFALDLDGTTVTDVVAIATGDYGRAVLANDHDADPLLRDAIAFASGGAATAIQTVARNLHLRNVLAIAPTVAGDALDIEGQGYCYDFSCPGWLPSEVDAKNTILRGALADVALTTNGYSGTFARLNVDHSNFRPGKVLAPGGNGYLNDRGANQSADPLFVNSQAGDYHPAAGSLTIDAGVDDPENASADIDGNPHSTGGGVDIGPYEYIAAPAQWQPDAVPAPQTTQPQTTVPQAPPLGIPAVNPVRTGIAKPTLPAACKKLKGSKRATCIKRQRALTKCKKIHSPSKRAACLKKAKRIR